MNCTDKYWDAFFCGLLCLVIFFIFPKVLVYQELDTRYSCFNGNCWFQKCFLPQLGNNFMEKSSREAEETTDKLPPAI